MPHISEITKIGPYLSFAVVERILLMCMNRAHEYLLNYEGQTIDIYR